MISNAKKTLLHVARQQLGLTEPEYRHLLIEHTGFMSSADPKFSDQDFKKMIDHFKILGFEVKRDFDITKMRKDPDELPGRGMLQMLEHLWEDYAQYDRRAKDLKFRQGFHEKLFGKPWPQTRREANIAIEAMKVRVKREIDKARRAS